MKHTFLRTLLLLSVLVAVVSAKAQDFYDSNGWGYWVQNAPDYWGNGGVVTLQNIDSKVSFLTIPETVVNPNDNYTYEVSGVNIYWTDNDKVTTINIPSSVSSFYISSSCNFRKSLLRFNVDANNDTFKATDGVLYETNCKYWDSGYYYGTRLVIYPAAKVGETFTIPDDVVIISDGAFEYCTNLKTINVPNVLSGIRYLRAGSVENINISESHTSYCSVDGIVYSKDKSTLVAYPSGRSDETYDIINGVTKISDNAFKNSENLKNVTLPEGLTTIGSSAFYGCKGLTCITLPEGLTTIDSYAFYGCKGLTSITLPEGLTTIDSYAFYGCKGLTSVTLPEGLTTIGSYAFYGCTGLTSVTIPNSVTTIDSDAFRNCSNLVELVLQDDNPNFMFVGGTLYKKSDMSIVFVVKDQDMAKLVIPEGVTSIPSSAYSGLTNIKEIVFPSTLTTIEYSAFSGCTGLTSVALPEGLTKIGQSAFYRCTGLTSITLPDGLTSIGDNAFECCTGLTSVTLPECLTKINDWTFYGCTGLTSVTLPDGLTSIGDHAFEYCTGLTSITLPEGLMSIGSDAFYGSGLTSVTFNCAAMLSKNYDSGTNLSNVFGNVNAIIIGDAVTSIGAYAFCGSRCKSLTIGKNVQEIGHNALGNLYDLKTLYYNAINASDLSSYDNYETPLWSSHYYSDFTSGDVDVVVGKDVERIPNYMFSQRYYSAGDDGFNGNRQLKVATVKFEDNSKCTEIGDYAFYDNRSLTQIDLPNSLEKINRCKFHYCTSLTSITLPEGLTTIESSAFYDCTSLTSVTLPKGLTTIDSSAFSDCTGLTSITLPDSITTIGHYAFYRCRSLREIKIPSSVANWDSNVFANCTGLQSVKFAEDVTAISYGLFQGCTGLKEIVLPNNLQSIGAYAFSGVTLKGISFEVPASVNKIGDNAFGVSPCIINSITPPEVNSNPITGTSSIVLVPEGSVAAYMADPVWSKYTIYANKYYVLDKTRGDNVKEAILANGVPGSDYVRVIVRDLPITTSEFQYINTTFVNMCEIDMSGADVTAIPSSAFSGNTRLERITLPSKLESIGSYAFEGCTSLDTIALPNHLKTIGAYAFTNCSSLRDVTFGNAITSIGERAFNNCTSLRLAHLNDALQSIGSYAFNGCGALSTVVAGSSLSSIGTYAFYGCSSLNTVVTGDNLSSIGNYAFDNCSSLTSMTFNEGLSTIGTYAFRKTGLRGDLVMPASLTSVGQYAFYQCTGITGIDFSKADAATSIGQYAFYGCTGATFAWLPKNMTSVRANTFEGCSNIGFVVFPDKLTTIGENAFKSNTKLKAVNLSHTALKTISSNAFNGCSGLISVSLPDCFGSSASLGVNTFSGCSKLQNISAQAQSPAACSGTTQAQSPFYGVSPNKCSLLIPSNDEAFAGYLMANYWGAFVSSNTHNNIDLSLANIAENGESAGYVTFTQGDITNEEDFDVITDSKTGLMVVVPTSSQIFVPSNGVVTFIIIAQPGYSIGSVVFNGVNVTTQVVDGIFVTTQLSSGDNTMSVTFVQEDHISVESVTISQKALSLPMGNTTQLTATVAPANATMQNVHWRSSNTSVATVSQEGLVTAVSEGSATITVTADDGALSDKCEVTVTNDNYLSLPSGIEASIMTGTELEVSLVNGNDIYGFQCDITLPDGVTIDSRDIQYSSLVSGMSVLYGTGDDGKSLRIIRYSSNNTPVSASAEARLLMTLPLQVGNIDGGDYNVVISNIRFSSDNGSLQSYHAPAVTTNLKVKGYAMGDVNQDEEVNITDIVAISYHIVHRPISGTFNERLADMDYDGEIDVNDLALVVRAVVSSAASKAPTKARAQETAVEGVCVGPEMSDDRRYIAFQCDITLPEDCRFTSNRVGLSPAIAGTHSAVANVEGRVMHVSVYSSDNAEIAADGGALLTIGVEQSGASGCAEITVSNVVFATLEDDEIVKVKGADSSLLLDIATGLQSVEGDDGERVYNLNGQLVPRSGKGVFIVNGKRVADF